MKIFKNKKLTICYTLLILMFILMGNSNNNPSPYIERIFKPINFDDGTFYYSTIIVMVVVYYCLKLINNEKEKNFINSFISRIIVAVIFISGSVWLNTYCTKFYKSFSHNLNSIYMNRDETSVDFDIKDEGSGYSGEAFEYILFDDDEENIVFKGSVDDYFVDEMDWS